MAKYYGVERSSDYLAHYGVMGMRWGVRKAIAAGNVAKLSKHYSKALKKLTQLSAQSNRDLMKRNWNIAKNRMIQGAIGSAALSAGLTGASSAHAGVSPRQTAINTGIAGLTGAAAGAIANSHGASSRRFISDRGHAKAVARRDKWVNDMNAAFKGTPYGTKKRAKTRASLAKQIGNAKVEKMVRITLPEQPHGRSRKRTRVRNG